MNERSGGFESGVSFHQRRDPKPPEHSFISTLPSVSRNSGPPSASEQKTKKIQVQARQTQCAIQYQAMQTHFATQYHARQTHFATQYHAWQTHFATQ